MHSHTSVSLIFLILCASSCIHQSSSAAIEGIDLESCNKIEFKDEGYNCTQDKDGSLNMFPILGNCTAYIKCDYVPGLGASLREPIAACGPGEMFDYKVGACAASVSKDGSCDQTRCETIIMESEHTEGGNGTGTAKSGQYNYPPATQTQAPNEHDTHTHEPEGRAQEDHHATEKVPLPPNARSDNDHQGHESEKKKEAKSEHGGNNLGQGLKMSGFLSVMMLTVTCVGVSF